MRTSDERDDKDRQLDQHRVEDAGSHLIAAQGVRIGHADDSLTVGQRGPTLLEDFHAREDGDDGVVVDQGVVRTTRAERTIPDACADRFANLIAGHRVWERPTSHVAA